MRRSRVIVTTTLAVAASFAATGYAAVRPAGSASAVAARSHHARVETRHGRLGTYLVDGRGRTLYLFRKDSRGRSRCFGACAQAWPPLTTRERPEAEHGAKASRLGTIRRGGTRQVTYAGHPLYRYAFDAGPGSTRGQGSNAFGARWYAVSRSGRAIR